MYKILDLRTGECFIKADFYSNTTEATYFSKSEAENALDDIIRVRNAWNPYDDCKTFIKEYFEVIEAE